MITKQQIELVRSLAQKKKREEHGLFVVEGEKIINDLYRRNLIPEVVYCTDATPVGKNPIDYRGNIETISPKVMERISSLKTPPEMLALYKLPKKPDHSPEIPEGLHLVLDGIQDPGNLGTIVRMADWFGITTIYCSENCVDLYNPKCIQSTMGAISSAKVRYLDLKSLLENACLQKISVYGTFMDGENIYHSDLSNNGLIVMGSEGQGISDILVPYMTHRLAIPTYPPGNQLPESLNVAVSTAIVCAEFRRRRFNT